MSHAHMNMRPDGFMDYSTPSTADFSHPRYAAIAGRIGAGLNLHRKNWEWVFILHHLLASGLVRPGARGLGFGVGGEALTAVLAGEGASIVATDAPADVAAAGGWSPDDNQLAAGLASIPRMGLDEVTFRRRVAFRPVDMRSIDADLRDFDFCWSSCALEHLGSLQAGTDFILESVNRLKPGGVAVHTTEFNLSSDAETLSTGWCVLYRRCDIGRLVAELRSRGHSVERFQPAPVACETDAHIDMPPYLHDPHLKLMLEGFVTTSAGLVIRRRQ